MKKSETRYKRILKYTYIICTVSIFLISIPTFAIAEEPLCAQQQQLTNELETYQDIQEHRKKITKIWTDQMNQEFKLKSKESFRQFLNTGSFEQMRIHQQTFANFQPQTSDMTLLLKLNLEAIETFQLLTTLTLEEKSDLASVQHDKFLDQQKKIGALSLKVANIVTECSIVKVSE